MLNYFLGFFLLLFGLCFDCNAQKNPLQPFQDKSSGFYGYQIAGGKVKINPVFSLAYPFTLDGFAKVVTNQRQGVINKKGKFVIDPVYEKVGWSEDTLSLYSQGLVGVKINGKWGLNNSKGDEVLSPRFEKIAPFTNGFAVVAEKNNNDQLQYGLIDATGKYSLPMSYQYLEQDNASGLIIALKKDENGEAWGVITNEHSEKRPFIYKKIKLIKSGLFALKNQTNKWGIYNSNLENIYPHHLDSISSIKQGKFIVKANDHYTLMNSNGKLNEPFKYKSLKLNESGLQGEVFKTWKLKYPKGKKELVVYYDSVKNVAKNVFAGYASGNTYLFNSAHKLILTGQYDHVAAFTDNHLLIYQNKLIGLADTAGNMVLPIQYTAVEALAENQLLVKEAGGGMDIFHIKGSNLTKGAYKTIVPQENGWFKVTLGSGKTQFLDQQLNLVGKEWEGAGNIKNKLVAVKENGLFGVTDFKDDWVISPYIDSLYLINEHFLLFYDNGRLGTINYKGIELYKNTELAMSAFPQGCILLKHNDKYGLLNNYGTEILPTVYDSISLPTTDSLVYAYQKGQKIYMDIRYKQLPQGNEFNEIEYDPKHTEGYFRAKVYGLWGFVDYLARIRVYCQYDDVHYFSEGLAGFKLGGKWGYLNARGKIVIQPVYEEINTFIEGKAIVKRNGKWGMINTNGEPIIPFEFDEISITSFGNYIVKQNGLTGIYRKQDLLSIYPKFDSVHDLGNGTALVEKDGSFGVNQLDGITIAYPEYEIVQYNPLDNSFFLLVETSSPE